MTKVLVTGGAGYVGSVLIPKLLDKGYKVRCFDNLMYKEPTLLTSCMNKNFEFVKGDIRNYDEVEKAVKDMDIIIHLSAIVGFPACKKDPRYARDVNYYGTVNVERARNPTHQKLIFASTGSVYGAIHYDIGETAKGICTEEYPPAPLTEYGKTKLEAENAIVRSDNWVIYRYATGFGLSPRMRLDLMPNDFTYQAVKNKLLVVYEKKFRRTFIHVRDMAESYLFALKNFAKIRDEIYNVGSEKMNFTKEDIANIVKNFVDYNLIYAETGKDPDKRDYEVSYEKIRKKGFETKIDMKEGIRELIKGYQMVDIMKPYSNA